MAQLIRGKIVNSFSRPEFTDKDTGEVKPGASFVQFTDEKVLKNGEKEFVITNVKNEVPAEFKANVGKNVLIVVQDSIYDGKKYITHVPGTKIEVQA